MKVLKVVFFFVVLLNLSLFAQNPCLIAHYPFSGNANDISGNNLHGSANGPNLTYDRFGNPNSAYLFDGIDDKIIVSNDSLLNFDYYEDYSVSLWIKTGKNQEVVTVNQRNMIMTQFEDVGANPTGFPFSIRIQNQANSKNGKLYTDRQDLKTCGNQPNANSDSLLNDSTDHHIVVTKNGSSIEIYIDNVFQRSFIDNTICTTKNTFDLYMGGKGGTVNQGHFKGIIDDVMIFECALDAMSIDSLFNLSPLTTDASNLAKKKMKIAPNPAKNYLSLYLPLSGKVQIDIRNIDGTIVQSINSCFNNSTYNLDVSKWSNGMYFLSFQLNGNENEAIKFVVNH